jgi:hypothetical protein
MPTIETSRPSRKRTPQSTASRAQVRASQRGAAEVGEELIGGTVYALANIAYTYLVIA